jgi:hypothetical protein
MLCDNLNKSCLQCSYSCSKPNEWDHSSKQLWHSSNERRGMILQYTYYSLQTKQRDHSSIHLQFSTNETTGIILQCSYDPLLAKGMKSFFSRAVTISKRKGKNYSSMQLWFFKLRTGIPLKCSYGSFETMRNGKYFSKTTFFFQTKGLYLFFRTTSILYKRKEWD